MRGIDNRAERVKRIKVEKKKNGIRMAVGAQMMQQSLDNAFWLTAANVVLSMLVLFWMLRFRSTHRRSLANERVFSETIENLTEGFYRSSMEGIQLYANRSLVELNGYSCREEMLACVSDIGREWYVQPGRRADFKRILERDGFVIDFVSEIYRHKTRERIWISENARIVRNPRTGEPLYYEGSVREVTEMIKRRKLEERLEKLANNVPGGLFQLMRDPAGRYVASYLSAGMATLLGARESDPDPLAYFAHIDERDRARYVRALQDSAKTLQPWTQDFRYQHPDGRLIWLHVTATPQRLEDGTVIWHGYLNEVTDRKEAEEQIQRLAFYDPLTELPNRRIFTDRLNQSVADCRRDSRHGAVLFLDLDNFKALNDTKGHETGDELLKKVAERLRESVRGGDLVSRFGGDEFLVLLPHLSGDVTEAVEEASGAASKILRQFCKGFVLDFGRHHCSPSIGVVVFDRTSDSASDIIKSADIAMFEAKKRGRNTYVIFDPGSLQDVSHRYLLQKELPDAITGNELAFVYQPQVDCTGAIVGAEALLRWNHPERGMLSPNEFVPLAEKSGLIMEINDWVLNEAVRTLARWKERPGMEKLSLSVNISVQQFRSDEFVPSLCRRLAAAGVDPRLLTLELTEQIMARDPGNVADRMRELKALGIRLSLDDFGTGYSSLSQLNNFPFDEIKIDGAFVSDLEQRSANRTLIEAILGMARGLNLSTVAEHVGSAWQVDFLQARGCNAFQGYHFHPPMNEESIGTLFEGEPRRKAS